MAKEKELLRQFEELVDKIDLNEIQIKEKMVDEIARFKKFQQVVYGNRRDKVVADLDIRDYAKYLLREGTDTEKRELMGCFKSKITLARKVIALT